MLKYLKIIKKNMTDSLFHDVINLSSVRNYYRRADGIVVRIFDFVIQYSGKLPFPYYRASIIKKFEATKDITEGEVSIPLLLVELLKYNRISEKEVQELRVQQSQLETSAQTPPSCAKTTDLPPHRAFETNDGRVSY